MITKIVVLLLAVLAESAYEGSFCSKEGFTGVCTNIRRCPDAQIDIKNRKKPQICDFTGLDPIVCCISSITITTMTVPLLTTTKSSPRTTLKVPLEYDYFDAPDKKSQTCQPVPPSLTSKPTGQKVWDKCIEYQEKTVFPCTKSSALTTGVVRSNRCHHSTVEESTSGDRAAALDEFPHMALLGYGSDVSNLAWHCSGSLISEKFILTSAYCTSIPDVGEVSYVQLGGFHNIQSWRNKHWVNNITRHPQYSPSSSYHDIALLELLRPIPLDEYTIPACLHRGTAEDDSRAFVTGLALRDYEAPIVSDENHKVSVLRKFNASQCASTYKVDLRKQNGFNETTQLCYGDPSTDACQGDVGGPIQIYNKQISCMYTILGVASSKTACGRALPGLYTRVASYLDWIEKIAWPSK